MEGSQQGPFCRLPSVLMSHFNRRDIVFIFLTGIFVTNAVLAEILGSKLFAIGEIKMTVGVLLWPVVFISTDIVNEYFGKSGVKILTYLTVGLISYAFLAMFLAVKIPAANISPVTDEQFSAVLGQSMWIIVGSIVAFLLSQLVDVFVFWFFRKRTGGKLLWLRATGSTVVSQLIDTFVVLGIAFWLPGKIQFDDYVVLSLTNYTYKLFIALTLTPLIYGSHNLIDKYLGKDLSDKLIEDAAKHSS